MFHILMQTFLLLLISVDSQTMEIGSDDTSNGFSEALDSEFHLSEHGEMENSESSVDLSLQQALESMQNAGEMHVSNDANRDGDGDDVYDNQTQEMPDEEEWPVERWLRLQAEEEAETNGRLTAPAKEIRKRAPKRKANNTNDVLINELRAKQIALVDEQIQLHKMQQENAAIAKEEATERMELLKTQRKIAEIDLNAKQNSN